MKCGVAASGFAVLVKRAGNCGMFIIIVKIVRLTDVQFNATISCPHVRLNARENKEKGSDATQSQESIPFGQLQLFAAINSSQIAKFLAFTVRVNIIVRL